MNIWETVLFGTAIGATVGCAVILRKVGFRHHRRRLELEHILLLVTQCGVFLYFLFQIFGGYYYLQQEDNHDLWRLLRMVTPILALVSTAVSTTKSFRILGLQNVTKSVISFFFRCKVRARQLWFWMLGDVTAQLRPRSEGSLAESWLLFYLSAIWLFGLSIGIIRVA